MYTVLFSKIWLFLDFVVDFSFNSIMVREYGLSDLSPLEFILACYPESTAFWCKLDVYLNCVLLLWVRVFCKLQLGPLEASWD